MTRRTAIATAAAALVTGALIGAPGLATTPGRLVPDPSFGAGLGWVRIPIRGWSAASGVATVVPGGKWVIAGQVFHGSESQIAVVRVLRSGRVDRTFGTRGVFRTEFPAAKGPYFATGIGVQPGTGKVVVTGGYGQGAILALRLRGSGALDRSFGTRRGYVTTAVGGLGESSAFGTDGSIIVGASNADAGGRPMIVAKYTRQGRPDRSFGGDGVVSRRFWNARQAASSGVSGLAVGPAGEITAAGHIDYIGGDGHGSAGVFRLTSTGRSVRSFGTSGHREVAFRRPSGEFASWFPCGLAEDRRGRVIVTGSGSVRGVRGAVLTVRLAANGNVNGSFGNRGDGRVVTAGVTSGNTTTCGAAATPGGGITMGVDKWVLGLSGRGRPDRALARSGVLTLRTPVGVGLGSIHAGRSSRRVAAGIARDGLFLARWRRVPGLG